MVHLTFCDNVMTLQFVGLFLLSLFFTTGLFWVAFSFALALGLATLLRKVLNPQLKVPEGTAILITGCSTGMGHDAALHFANEGFVVFAGVRKQSDQQNLQKEFSGQSKPKGTLIPILLDITSEESIAAAKQVVISELRRTGTQLYGLFNNAGYNEAGMLEVISLDRIRTQFETNVFGHIAMAQAFLPLLRECRKAKPALFPRIIWTSSAVGQLTFPGSSAYSATKHAVEALSQSYLMELSHWGIKSVVVQPGAISTNFYNTAKRTRSTPLDQRVDPAVREYYEQCIERSNNSPPPTSPSSMAIDAFTSALLDTQPLPAYRAGNDAQIGIPLNHMLLVPNTLGQLVGKKVLTG